MNTSLKVILFSLFLVYNAGLIAGSFAPAKLMPGMAGCVGFSPVPALTSPVARAASPDFYNPFVTPEALAHAASQYEKYEEVKKATQIAKDGQ